MVRAIIVENEPKAAGLFVARLNKLFADVEVAGVCESVEQSLAAINKYNPDIVFLDVELNAGETGFDVLRQLAVINFEIIFTTAFEKYAIDAIRHSALDYLVKPVTDEDLAEAFERFRKKKYPFHPRQAEILFLNLTHAASGMMPIALPTMKGMEFILINEIFYIEAYNNYVTLNMTGKENRMVVCRTLKDCERLLQDRGFCRISKSHLINLAHLKKYDKGKEATVQMKGDFPSMDVSEHYKNEFLEKLKTLKIAF